MIVYSVTITIDKNIESEWLKWMNEIHIPEVIKTGYFIDWTVKRLILPADKESEMTFRVDYFLSNFEDYQEYLIKSAPKLQEEHSAKFEGKFKASRMVYAIIEN
jgi:hypothetical protein